MTVQLTQYLSRPQRLLIFVPVTRANFPSKAVCRLTVSSLVVIAILTFNDVNAKYKSFLMKLRKCQLKERVDLALEQAGRSIGLSGSAGFHFLDLRELEAQQTSGSASG